MGGGQEGDRGFLGREDRSVASRRTFIECKFVFEPRVTDIS